MAFVLAAVAGLIIAGSAFAQDDTAPFGGGAPRDGSGLLQDYISTAMADAMGISVEELQASHDGGETFYDLALVSGFEADEIRILIQDARTSALEAAVADGVITQEQFDAMQSRGGGRGGKRGGQGGFGSGAWDGSGQFDGSGMRGQGGSRQGQGGQSLSQ